MVNGHLGVTLKSVVVFSVYVSRKGQIQDFKDITYRVVGDDMSMDERRKIQ